MRLPRFYTAAAVVAFAIIITGSTPAVAQSGTALDPADVVIDAPELDGSTVILEGEAIGEALHAHDDFVWVNVLGERGTAIGIVVDRSLADAITTYGDYKHNGDTVRVTGIVNAACDRHGGDLDVHASNLEIVQIGTPRIHEAASWKAILGVSLLIVGAILGLVVRARRRPTHA